MSDDLARDPVIETPRVAAAPVAEAAPAVTAAPVEVPAPAKTAAPVEMPASPAVPASDRLGPAPGAPGAPLPAADASLLGLVDRLAGLLERSDLVELEVEAGGTGIVLRKAGALVAPTAPAASSAPIDPPASASPADHAAVAVDAGADAQGPSRASVLAPLTGIFYASPSPGSPPFVEVGREVAVGQVIGLIEAMKLFNEIKSDKGGRVVRVVAENGALVKAKHPLIEVEPL
jgi:acetyl-CoA carboxylase biotin carboxyl carrier protein